MGGRSKINAGSVVTGLLATFFGLAVVLCLAWMSLIVAFAFAFGWSGVAVLAVVVGLFATVLTYGLQRGRARS